MKISANAPCPCHSGKKYKKCCKIYHEKVAAKDAKTLMQSRYSAFALAKAEYIIQTTHPKNPDFSSDTQAWKAQIQQFCFATKFVGLKILEVEQGEDEAYVTFKAELLTDTVDTSFTERSYFQKQQGRWLYHSGVIES